MVFAHPQGFDSPLVRFFFLHFRFFNVPQFGGAEFKLFIVDQFPQYRVYKPFVFVFKFGGIPAGVFEKDAVQVKSLRPQRIVQFPQIVGVYQFDKFAHHRAVAPDAGTHVFVPEYHRAAPGLVNDAPRFPNKRFGAFMVIKYGKFHFRSQPP